MRKLSKKVIEFLETREKKSMAGKKLGLEEKN